MMVGSVSSFDVFGGEASLSLVQYPSSGVHGLTLWDSGLVLSKTLEVLIEMEWSFGSRVIEIGSGLALPSLTLATANKLKNFDRNLSILVTDNSNEVLKVVENSIQENQLSETISVKYMDILEEETQSFPKDQSLEDNVNLQFDLIIFSDMLYDESIYGPLVSLLDKISHKESKLIFANEKRDFGKEMEFYRLLGERFSFKQVKDLHPVYQSEDIYIFQATKK